MEVSSYTLVKRKWNHNRISSLFVDPGFVMNLIKFFFRILLFSDNVLMEFAGQDLPMFKNTKQGRIYLTTHRVIFNTKNVKDPMQSFSAPFISMSDVELEQPVFGANYIKGKIRAQPNGNWTGEAKFKMSFKSGGCIDFGQALLRAASMAQRNGGGMVRFPSHSSITLK